MPLLERVGTGEGLDLSIQVRSAQGGAGRAIAEFRIYQRVLETGLPAGRSPDIVVVAIDGNCATFAKKRAEIQKVTRDPFRHMIVSACPDPHIERWYLADPNSFHEVVGNRPDVGTEKCERGHYKRLLRDAVTASGHLSTLGGIEFARELARKMNLYRAARRDPSFKAFLSDLSSKLKSLTHRKAEKEALNRR